jgi:ABC-2 type transport system ATP-binding protein
VTPSVVNPLASPDIATPAIEATALTKRFGAILALDRLDLLVPGGSVFGLLGPNGAGKTTAIRILTGLARPSSGNASVAGVEVALDQPELRRRLGYLDQDPRFYGWMTGRELLELVGRLHGLTGLELRSRVDEMLARTGLAAEGRRRIGGYSGGMRQRLGIAQALLHRPRILILDEPVSSLDPEGRRDLLTLMGELRGEATVVFSTHVLADVERICDRVAILDRGRLVTEGPLEELLAAHARPVYRLVPVPGQDAAVGTLVERLRTAPWATDVSAGEALVRVAVSDPVAAAREILPLVVAAGVTLESFERARPTLEDVFIELVGPATADDLDGRGFIRPREVSDR